MLIRFVEVVAIIVTYSVVAFRKHLMDYMRPYLDQKQRVVEFGVSLLLAPSLLE